MNLSYLFASALLQGLLYAPLSAGVFIAFRILNTPDLTVDGSFVLGMAVCAAVTNFSGSSAAGLATGMAAAAAAGLVTGLLQTKLGINPILSGILTMTALYSVNYFVLGAPLIPVAKEKTVFGAFSGTLPLSAEWSANILLFFIVGLCALILAVFFKTRQGMAIRATGDNEEMVRSSSINSAATRCAGIMISNALVGLSGALICHKNQSADINYGAGMLVAGLAAVIIGQVIFGKHGVTLGIISAIAGSFLYRAIIQAAYLIEEFPSYAVKLLSVSIVAAALALPAVKKSLAETASRKRRLRERLAAGEEP